MATIFFKDLPLDFTPHPVSGDVRPITNETAIKRSLSNLIKTKRGTRPFYPEYGTTISNYLFENDSVFTRHNIKQELTETIARFEPRVSVKNILIENDDYGITIKLDYVILNVGRASSLITTIARTA